MEHWRLMKEFDDLYSISSNGRVRREHRTVKIGNRSRLLPSKIMSVNNNGSGYMVISASINNKKVVKYAHRMVYKYFIGELIDGMHINHIDYDRANNSKENLNQISVRDNQHHSHINKSKTSNTPCVYFESGKYVARYYIKGKSMYCGRHKTESEAKKALDTHRLTHNF